MSMPLHYEDDRVQITKVVVGPMVNNVFFVGHVRTGADARCAETDRCLTCAYAVVNGSQRIGVGPIHH